MRLCLALLSLASTLPAAWSETPATVRVGDFQTQIFAAERLAANCETAAPSCDPAPLPPEERVRRADGTEFRASWQWLRAAVSGGKAASAPDRAHAMRQARAHLAELAAEVGGTSPAGDRASFPRARTAATAILSQPEFQADAGPTWIDRQIARAQDWLLRLLLGMNRIGEHNPWLAPLAEWTCFLFAAGGLVYFVRRSLARQALRIALGENAAAAQRDGLEATDWGRYAQERAAAGDWREGIHGLYWAAILSLETRRAWRPNPTRTPREYLGLLRAGSEAEHAMRALTSSFERVWYGDAKASEAAFRAAEANFASIDATDLRQGRAETRGAEVRSAAAGAV